jgi:cobalt-zinc-cadmium efflux system protein
MMAVEILGGLWTDSLMLLSDAAHMASHALALIVSWFAFRLSALPRDSRSHFGLHRAEILAALANGVGLLAFTVWIAWEAIARFWSQTPVAGAEMTVIAAVGLVVNFLTAVILARAGTQDLNTRSAFLHMLGDTLSSVAIVIGGTVLWFTGWVWIDPLLSLLVAAVIVWWGIGLLRQALRVLLEQSPAHIEPDDVRAAILASVPAVHDVHDLHVWEITSGYVCLTAHLVVDDAPLAAAQAVQREVASLVEQRFRIGHATLQLECRSPN